MCAKVVDKSDKTKHRMHDECTENITSTVHQKCLDRADEWAFEVKGRLAVCGTYVLQMQFIMHTAISVLLVAGQNLILVALLNLFG